MVACSELKPLAPPRLASFGPMIVACTCVRPCCAEADPSMSGEGTTSTSNVKGRSSSGLRESSRKLELDKRIGLDMVVRAREAESGHLGISNIGIRAALSVCMQYACFL